MKQIHKNKKGEGTSSSMLISLIIFVALMTTGSLYLSSVISHRNQMGSDIENIVNLENITSIQDDIDYITEDFIETIDEEEINNTADEKWYDKFLNIPIDAWTNFKDLIDNQAFRTIRKLPNISESLIKTITATIQQVASYIPIPQPITLMLMAIIAITIVVKFIQIIWRIKHV